MLQDIQPHIFKNEFTPRKPEETDLVLVFRKDEPLMFGVEEFLLVPTVEMMKTTFEIQETELTYLFSIDEDAIYIMLDEKKIEDKLPKVAGYDFYTPRVFRTLEPKWIGFAGITGGHLSKWYKSNRFCGCCGSTMEPKADERAMRCAQCGFTDYPKICPAVIVAITNGDKLLLTKYANRAFTRYALVAGFCEIGESVEETIRREVLEETGIKIKNLRYYKSQPWGFSESMLMGFFVELDGDDTITLDTDELKEGVWVNREDIPDDTENELSLTYTMMQAFKYGREME